MTIFSYQGSCTLNLGITYNNTLFSSTSPTFDAYSSANESISSFDKTSPSLDFSNNKNNSSSSFPTTFDSGYKLPVTFDVENQIIVSSGQKSFSGKEIGSGNISISSALLESYNISPYIGSGTIRLSGNLVHPKVDFTPHYGREKNIGIGTYAFVLSGVGSASHPYQTPENTQLFSIGKSEIPSTGRTFDQNNSVFDLDSNRESLLSGTFDKNYLLFQKYNRKTIIPLNFDSNISSPDTFILNQTIPNFALVSRVYTTYRGSGSLSISAGITSEKNTESYVGIGTLVVSGTRIEKNASSYVGSGSITISGRALEAYPAQTPENTQLFSVGKSQIPVTAKTFDQNNSVFDLDSNKSPIYPTFDKDYLLFQKYNRKTIIPLNFDSSVRTPDSFISDTQTQTIPNFAAVSRVYTTYRGSGSLSISAGITNEKNTEAHFGSGTLVLSGNLTHPKVDFTPHYGREKNIGIGTYAFVLSGVGSASHPYQTPENTQLFSIGKSEIPSTAKTFDENKPVFDRNTDIEPYYPTFDRNYILFQKYNRKTIVPLYFDADVKSPDSFIDGSQSIPNFAAVSRVYTTYRGSGSLSISAGITSEKNTEAHFGSGTIRLSGNLVHPKIDFTPHYGREKNIGIGTYAFSLSGVGSASHPYQTPENTQLFTIGVREIPSVGFSGNIELYSTFDKSYFLFQKYNRASVVPLRFDSNVIQPNIIGSTQLIYSTALESRIYPTYRGSGSLSISAGITSEKNTEAHFGSGTILLSGNLVHPKVDFTPHYGREKNIGIGTYAFSLSGVGSASHPYQTPENTQLFSIGVREIPSVGFSGNVELYSTFDKSYFLFQKYNRTSIVPLRFDSNVIQPDIIGSTQLIYSTALESRIYPTYRGSGSLSISAGITNEQNTESYVGLGTLVLSGNLTHPKVDFTPHYGREKNIGIGTYAFVLSGVGSASHPYQTPENTQLFSIGKSEIPSTAKTFDENKPVFDRNTDIEPYYPTFDRNYILFQKYNRKTIVPLYFDADVKSPDSFIDGSQSIPNFGGVSRVYTTYRGSGSLTISGVEVEKNTESYVGLGTLVLSGIATEKNPQSYVGSGSLTISGVEVEKNTESYVGVGTLVSGKREIPVSVRTFDENKPVFDRDASTQGIYPSFDKTTIRIDKFNLPTILPPTFDVNVVSPDTFTEFPLGSQYIPNLGGVSRRYNRVGSGSLTISGRALEAYPAQTPENTQLFVLSGVATEKNTESYVGLGTLVLSAGISSEKNTESYVGVGTLVLSGVEIEKNTESYVGSGSINISGGNIYSETNSFVAGGTLRFFGRQSGLSAYRVIGSGSITLSGVEVEKNTESYVGLGNVNSGKSEIPSTAKTFDETKSVFDRNTDIEPYYPTFDRNYILFQKYNRKTIVPLYFDADVKNPDSFIDGSQSIPNFAAVSRVYTTYRGSGSLTISGVEVEKNTESYVGSGSFVTTNAINTNYFDCSFNTYKVNVTNITCDSREERDVRAATALESFTANPPENVELFTISGSRIEKNTESYVGVGTLVSGKREIPVSVRTFDENKPVFDRDATTQGIYPSFDKTNIRIDKFNLPTILPPTFDVNVVSPDTFTEFPLGSQFIPNLGRVSRRYNTLGLGSLTISGRALEAYPAQTPENTQLFVLSGVATEKNTESYVGFASTIRLSAGISSEKNTESYVGVGTLVLSGIATEKNPQSYVGSGSITLSGVEVEKNTESYVGLGTLVLSAAKVEKRRKSYVGSGSITLSGVEVEKNTESYVGVGTLVSGKRELPITVRTFDESKSVFDLNASRPPIYPSFDKNTIRIDKFNLPTILPLTFDVGVKNPDSFINYVQFIPNLGGVSRRYSTLGSGSLTISGVEVEKNTESYVGLGTIFLSAAKLESRRRIYVGLGTIRLSGVEVEKRRKSYVGSGSITLSAAKVEKRRRSFVGLGTIRLSGNLVHPNIDFTPHYGREKNIGIGTIGIQLSGSAFESITPFIPQGRGLVSFSGIGSTREIANYGYYGDLRTPGTSGKLTIYGTPLIHPFVDYTPHYGKDKNIGIGTYGFRLYGSVIPPATFVIVGIGTIRIRGAAKTTTILPVTAGGLFQIYGSGNESFSYPRYVGIGTLRTSGQVKSRYFNVYTAVPTGTITLFGVKVEKNTESYVGLGTLRISSTIVEKNTESYVGLGTLRISSTAIEKFGANPQENIQLFSVSGKAKESFTPATHVGIGTIRLSGSKKERKRKSYVGRGQVTLSGTLGLKVIFNRVGRGTIRFVRYHVDEIYDTVDSLNITSDNEYSSNFSFIANPQEQTVLFHTGGNSLTKKQSLFKYTISSGSVGISGSSIRKKTKSHVGIGTIYISSRITRKISHSYRGTGSFGFISGSANAFGANPQENTQLFNISGSALTKVTKLKKYTGIGTEKVSGSSSTKKLSKISYSGIGTFHVYGNLVYPNIKFIPGPKGAGSINIVGQSNIKITNRYSQTSGTLFAIGSVKDSYTKSTYTGIGTIFVQSTVGVTINNPYQIPRSYVCII